MKRISHGLTVRTLFPNLSTLVEPDSVSSWLT